MLAEQTAACSQLALQTNQEMVESMKQQLKQANHPCIVVRINKATGTECFYKKRRQLHVSINLGNIGNGPAISIYAFGWFRLKYSDYRGSELVPMFFMPGYIPNLAIGEKRDCGIRFETKEINALITDLRRSYLLNMERIKNDPTQSVFRHPDLLIKIYYRNISNQWYEITYQREVNNLLTVKERQGGDVFIDNYPEYKKPVPPGKLLSKESFDLCFISEAFSMTNVQLVSADVLKSLLFQYKNDIPMPFNEDETVHEVDTAMDVR